MRRETALAATAFGYTVLTGAEGTGLSLRNVAIVVYLIRRREL